MNTPEDRAMLLCKGLERFGLWVRAIYPTDVDAASERTYTEYATGYRFNVGHVPAFHPCFALCANGSRPVHKSRKWKPCHRVEIPTKSDDVGGPFAFLVCSYRRPSGMGGYWVYRPDDGKYRKVSVVIDLDGTGR